MDKLKHAVSQTIKYADGSETVINYNELGEKVSEVSATPQPSELSEVSSTVEEAVETPEAAEEAVVESVEESA